MSLHDILKPVLRSSKRVITRLAAPAGHRWLYRDDVVKLDEHAITIRAYYWPFGSKRIPYEEIQRFERRPLKSGHGQFRVQGIDLRRRWYSRDRKRGEKELAIDLDVGKPIRPVLTPDDPIEVLAILQNHVSLTRNPETADPGAS